MSARFEHKDLDGDKLEVSAGSFGAVFHAHEEYSGEQVSVAVRAEHLPELIKALEGILKDAA